MRILSVSPVPAYATWDVWQGQTAGLRALGAEVLTWHYNKTWTMFSDFREMMLVTGRARYPGPVVEEMAGARIVLAALDHDIDLVYFVAPAHTAPITAQRLRKIGVKTAAYHTESPYDDDRQLQQAKWFDYNFVCDRASVPAFREVNRRSWYVGHAYDPERHTPGQHQRDLDCVLVTTLFPSRIDFLESVDWEGIDLHLYGLTSGVGNVSPIHRFVRGSSMNNADTVNFYQRSKIGVNLHRVDTMNQVEAEKQLRRGKRRGVLGASPKQGLDAYSIGPRAYELAACGVLQICDDSRPELRDVFGETVPTYRDASGVGPLIRRYLDDPQGRDELAERQREAVKPFTFQHRMATVLEAVA